MKKQDDLQNATEKVLMRQYKDLYLLDCFFTLIFVFYEILVSQVQTYKFSIKFYNVFIF